MISVKEISWLAGLLEGEGCFAYNKKIPLFILGSIDLDIIEKTRDLINPKISITIDSNRKNIYYHFNVYGNLAIQWMMTIYPLMGRRRKTKIKEVINIWKSIPSYRKGFCKKDLHLLTYENTYGINSCKICSNQKHLERNYYYKGKEKRIHN